MDTETLEKLVAAHPNTELHLLSSDGFEVVVKRPDRPSYKRFRAMLSDATKRADAPEILLRDCMVWPDRSAFERMLDQRPAIGDVLASRLLDIAGMTAEAEAKKL